MAVQGQPASVVAGMPIDESSRREATAVGKSNRANYNVRQDDMLALRKRPGFTALPLVRAALGGGTNNRSVGRKVFAHEGAPCIIDGAYLDCFIESSNANFTRARAPELTYRLTPVPSFSSPTGVLGDYAGGYAAYSAGTTLAVIEVATGVLIQTVTLSVAAAFVTSLGNRYLIAMVPQASPYINIFDAQNPTAGWSSTSWSNGTLQSSITCAVGTDRFAAAWVTGGGNTVNVATYDATGTQLATTTVNASGLGAANTNLSLAYSAAGKLWVAFSDAGSLKAVGLNPTTLAVTSTLAAVTTFVGGGGRAVFASAEPGGNARLMLVSSSFVKIASVTTTGGNTVLAGTAYQLNGTCAGSAQMGRPFYINGRHYIGAYSIGATVGANNLQGLLTLVDWSDDTTAMRPIANIEPGLVSSWTSLTPDSTTGKFHMLVSCVASGVNRQQSISSGDTVLGIKLVELDYTAKSRWQIASLGQSTFLSGAVLSVFDGANLTEAGFLAAPSTPTTSLSGTGITGTNYRYVAIYEDVDASGNWVVSGVSQPSNTVSPANQAVTVSVPPLCVTSRASKPTMRVAFYRTLTGGNAPYYRVGYVANDITALSLSFVDQVSDAALSAKGKLYAPNLPGTAGESLDRRAPPGMTDVCAYNGMLVGIKADTVYYSGQPVYGEAAWFNPVFAVPVYGGDDFTALAAIDGTLYLFKSDRIYSVSGDVPSDNGLQGGLGQPRLLASDVGCVDPDTVVETSMGLFFRSARGIELLDRSGTVQFIGVNVYATVDANPVTTSAVLDDRNGVVRFTLAPTVTSGLVSGSGVDLVYDLILQTWVSYDTKTGAVANEASQSACTIRNRNDFRYAWLGTNGVVYVEKDLTDATACLDGSSWVPSIYELPPWNLGLQVEQVNFGALILFSRDGAAGLLIEEADDYSTTYSPLHTWSETETLGQNQLEFRPKIRASAVQLRVRDTAPATLGTGKGLTFVGVTFDIGANQGPNKGSPRANSGLRK